MRLAEGVADLHFWDRQAGPADLHWVSIHHFATSQRQQFPSGIRLASHVPRDSCSLSNLSPSLPLQ